METKQRVLLRLLAEQDAFMVPCRHFGNRSSNVYVLRRRYDRIGLSWRSAEAESKERKQAERALAVLERSGDVIVARGGRVVEGVRLTDQGDRHARRLAGLPPISDSIVTMQEIIRLVGPKGLVLEPRLAWEGAAYGDARLGKELGLLELMLLPALVRGWVSAAADVHGHVGYGVTAVGLAVLANPPKADRRDYPAVTEASRERRALYDGTLTLAEARLSEGKLEPREIGLLPVPAAAWTGQV